jgi:hypothetical protein
MRKLITGLLLLSHLSVQAFEYEGKLEQLLSSSDFLVCKTAGKLIPKSKIKLNLKKEAFNVLKFNRNDDPTKSFMFPKEKAVDHPLIKKVLGAKVSLQTDTICNGIGPLVNPSGIDSIYQLKLDEQDLKGRKIKGDLILKNCLFAYYLGQGTRNHTQVWNTSNSAGATVKVKCAFK